MRSLRTRLPLTAAVLVLAGIVALRAPAAETNPEERTAQKLESVRTDPLALRDFLARMPKGADLHSHLSGAIYAETHIRDAGEDHLCIDQVAKAFTKSQPVLAGAEPEPVCEAGDVPADDLPKKSRLYNALIDSFSMRSFVPATGETGHDHFFAAFTKFGGNDPSHTGEWLDEVATRAARQNVQYLELMATPSWHRLNDITNRMQWREDLGALRDELLVKGLADDAPLARAFWDKAEALRNAREHCGTPDAVPACQVETRYIFEVFRNTPKTLVFAQTLLGFEIAAADPRVVGINFVGTEDDQTAMADYAEQMRMVGFLRGLYPKVHVSLHAGELAPGLVPPEGLCCHVRLAVDEAKTDRIGHGVDVMYEDRPDELMKDMAAKHVLVEINLTSNDDVLGVSDKDHPFPTYRKAGVPVALSTDDEGIERIDLTHEYVRAVETYDLAYADLKQLVRASLEHAFLPGASLWQEADDFTRPVAACRSDIPSTEKPSASCATFLGASEKAQQQWELERRFREFEADN
jgi:adenosine deaminase